MKRTVSVFRNIYPYLYSFVVCIVFISMCLSELSFAEIANFEGDPDLKIALNADPALATDRLVANRSVAEQAYIRYLDRSDNPGQRAKVYFNLGHMYSAGARPHLNEPLDIPKAKEYLEACIKESPTGICRETLWARTMLVSIAPTMEARVEQELAVYKFINTIDEQYLQKNTILVNPNPLVPDDAVKPDREAIESQIKWDMEVLEKYNKSIIDSTRENVITCCVYEALDCKSPELALRKIIEELPEGDALRSKAVSALQKLQDGLLDGVVSDHVASLNSPLNNMGTIKEHYTDQASVVRAVPATKPVVGPSLGYSEILGVGVYKLMILITFILALAFGFIYYRAKWVRRTS